MTMQWHISLFLEDKFELFTEHVPSRSVSQCEGGIATWQQCCYSPLTNGTNNIHLIINIIIINKVYVVVRKDVNVIIID